MMKTITVTVARIYITDESGLLKKITTILQDEFKIRGGSVFRAISGFGESGSHSSSFLDFSLNLPLVIEFFDSPEKIEQALTHLNTFVKPEHILFWDAKANKTS